MERWLSGLKQRSTKPSMGNHPWVQIPPSPPNLFIIGIRSMLMLVDYATQGYVNHPMIEDA